MLPQCVSLESVATVVVLRAEWHLLELIFGLTLSCGERAWLKSLASRKANSQAVVVIFECIKVLGHELRLSSVLKICELALVVILKNLVAAIVSWPALPTERVCVIALRR